MSEKILEHRIAKDYGMDAVDLNFDRDDIYWAVVLYQIEAEEAESATKRGNNYGRL